MLRHAKTCSCSQTQRVEGSGALQDGHQSLGSHGELRGSCEVQLHTQCCACLQVIAFAMKEYGWSLEETLKFVRTKRAVVRPNKAFMRQLTTYEGILAARY